MRDIHHRNIHYLRISITDRCNLRCRYCMPDEIEKYSQEEVLSYEEIVRIARIMTELGIDTVRITGGEPLMRKEVDSLITQIRRIPGINKIGLTTNGILLKDQLPSLKTAGLDRVNVSLDTLSEENFRDVTRGGDLGKVLSSILEGVRSGITVKINCIPMYGVNVMKQMGDHAWDGIFKVAELAKTMPISVRFIEMMPIGQGKSIQMVPYLDFYQALKKKYPSMQQMKEHSTDSSGPATYYKVDGFLGNLGFIPAVHQKFCSSCNRIRLTATGFLKTCLAYECGIDVRALLRNGSSDEEIKRQIENSIYLKPSEHHFKRTEHILFAESRSMNCIGG